MSVKDMLAEFKKLHKSMEETQMHGDSYNHIARKLTDGRETAEVEVGDEQWDSIIRAGREAKLVASKADRVCNACIEKLQALTGEKRKKSFGSGHNSFAGKRYKGDTRINPNILPNGRLVAARTSKDPEEWILATVVNYNENTQKYEVEDEDPGDESDPEPIRRHYNLPSNRLIALPTEDSEKIKEFPKGTQVLAVFPNTTTFYSASVVQAPKGKKSPEYILKFDDDEDETLQTPQRRVNPKYVVSKDNLLSNMERENQAQ